MVSLASTNARQPEPTARSPFSLPLEAPSRRSQRTSRNRQQTWAPRFDGLDSFDQKKTLQSLVSPQGRGETLAMTTPPSIQRRLRLAKSLIEPASKAYLVGYLLDLIPTLLKTLLRFVAREIKRVSTVHKRAAEERNALKEAGSGRMTAANGEGTVIPWSDIVLPTLHQVPCLGVDILRAAATSLGPQGMAVACAAAMLGWAILDETLSALLIGSVHGSNSNGKISERSARVQLLRVWSCFIAAALSSGTALMVMQKSADVPSIKEAVGQFSLSPSGSFGNIKRSLASRLSRSHFETGAQQPQGRPTPLTPGDHCLARSTSLSISGTPKLDGSRSPPLRSTLLAPVSFRAPESSSGSSGKGSFDPTPPTESRSTNRAATVADNPAATPRPHALGKPSPTVDLTLFALVRGLDTFVRASPLFLGVNSAAKKGTRPANLTVSASVGSAAAPKASSIIGKARSRQDLGQCLCNGRRLRCQRAASSLLSNLLAMVSNQTEGITFVLCCAVIMWSWFYAPERLPPTYVKWITNLATMDRRLLLALRCIRSGKPYVWNYQSTEMEPASIDMLGSLSESLGYPYEWGDPSRLPGSTADARSLLLQAKAANAKARAQGRNLKVEDRLRPPRGEPGYVLAGASGPRGRGEMGGIPCEIVHCGVGGSSCLANVGLRWIRGWKLCMGIYIPVHLLPSLLLNPSQFTKRPIETITKVLGGSARSASFLATYIASIWFMVCFGRTMVLPRLLPGVSHSFWDRGLGPLMGSFVCGLAIFIEERRKRAEMALYVAPRALYVLAEMARPGWLSQGKQGAIWAERVICGIAVGLVVTAARFRPDFLRGVTSIMAWVVRSMSRDIRLAAHKA